jgi:hypothetical protein
VREELGELAEEGVARIGEDIAVEEEGDQGKYDDDEGSQHPALLHLGS